MIAKDIVVKFYESVAILSKNYLQEVLHEELLLDWTSSKGFVQLDKDDILALSKEIRLNYYSLRCEVHQVIAEGNQVAIRYTHYVSTFENPDEELVLATFNATWELKDGLLYRGYQMSHLVI
ncbi:nuclear transport factor 2 family protein [Flavobacterium sp. JP2137]|uniref:nuclear transport factor 2 family protein n=1 Tax=Flavobacterium sp. JP2137 TaxID=3414510 RepID=UPI003D2FAEAA